MPSAAAAAIDEDGGGGGAGSSANSQPGLPRKPVQDPKYMHRPPRIVPNYGKKHRGLLPKSNVSRVLLYDNVTQQQMLDVKLTYLHTEQKKAGRLMDMHRKSFIVRRIQKQRQVAESILRVDHELPDLHVPVTNGHNAATKTGGTSTEHTPRIPKVDTDTDANNDENKNTDPNNNNSNYDQEEFAIQEEPDKEAAAEEDNKMNKRNNREDDENEKGDNIADVEIIYPHPHMLPSLLHQDRHGANSSTGFTLNNRPHFMGQKRVAQTAAPAFRDAGPQYSNPGALPDIFNGGSTTSGGSATNGAPRAQGGESGERVLLVTEEEDGLTRVLHTFGDEDEAKGNAHTATTTAKAAHAANNSHATTTHHAHYSHHHNHGFHHKSPRQKREEKAHATAVIEHEEFQLLMERTTADVRYLHLEQLLVRLDRPNEGYLELSPSFHSPRQAAHLSRPPSFRHRRRSRLTSGSSVSSKGSSRPVSVRKGGGGGGGGRGGGGRRASAKSPAGGGGVGGSRSTDLASPAAVVLTVSNS